MSWIFAAYVFAGLCTSIVAESSVQTFELSSDVLTRTLVVKHGQLRTVQIRNRITGQTLIPGDLREPEGKLPQSPEFEIRLAGGQSLSTKDYRVIAHKTSQIPQGTRWIFSLQPLEPTNPQLQIEYLVKDSDHFLRKRITVTGSALVDAISVESLVTAIPGKRGGFGQPIFLGDFWFCGLEYPAGENAVTNGHLQLTHWPGKREFTSQWGVIGGPATPQAAIFEEFDAYLTTLRRPLNPSLQYNGWFDLRGEEITPQRLEAKLRLFEEKLLTPYGLSFDAFVLDHGFEDPNQLWRPSPRWPEGLKPLVQQLANTNSKLGLWLPLNGYLLDRSLGNKEGWERSDHSKGCFCLAGPHYHAALRDALQRILREGDVRYLKHDFNFLACAREGHGHLPTDRHGREANVDALIALLAFERQLQPGIFLNVTSNLWPSPWWLAHCDTLWMGGADYAEDWELPADTPRAAEMTFRDDALYRLLRIEQTPIPPSALMTHGIIRGHYEAGHPEETLEEWSDYVMMYLGRGTMLHELYLSPELMPDTFWPVLAKGIHWARSNAETLVHTRMIGGPPRQALYGFVHWSTRKGIVCLRNPTSRPATYVLSKSERPARLPVVQRWHPLVIYPYREHLPVWETAEKPPEVTLPAGGVLLLELYQQLPEALRDLPEGRFELADNDGSAELIMFASPDVPPPQLAVPLVQDKKGWEVGLKRSAAEPLVMQTLTIVRRPASGCTIDVSGGCRPHSIGYRPPSWDRATYSFPCSEDLQSTVSAWLPPTPFYPQQCRLEATFRTIARLKERSVIGLSPGIELPIWPAAPHARLTIEDLTVMEDATIARRRSSAESLAWILVLGTVPVGATALLVRRFTVGHGRCLRLALFLLASGAVTVLYFLTPLGVALSRSLSEASPY